jgi:hypothetical protein
MTMIVASIIFKRNNFGMYDDRDPVDPITGNCLDSITEKTALYGSLIVFMGIPFLFSLFIFMFQSCRCCGFVEWWVYDPELDITFLINNRDILERDVEQNNDYSSLERFNNNNSENQSAYGN